MSNDISIKNIPERKIGDYTLRTYHRLSYAGNSMLICRESGTTIVLSDALAECCEVGEIPRELKYKLISRGFAYVPGVPSLYEERRVILPTFFLIDLTNGCNLNCSYCFRVPDSERRVISDDMLIKICEYIMNHCLRYGIRAISIQPWGGEPLLCIEKIVLIRQFFREYPEISVEISVETNGTLLTKENLRILAENRIHISISVDGSPDIHDRQRKYYNGLPSSEIIRKNMQTAAENNYRKLGGICVLTEKSVGKIDEILDYVENTLDMGSIKLNLMRQPAYYCEGVRALTEKEIVAVAGEIVDSLLKRRKKGSRIRESGTEDRLKNLIGCRNRNICNSAGCCGGRKMVSFDMDGNIYPCELTDWEDERLGNVKEDPDLCEIIQNAIKKNSYFAEKKSDLCKECPWWYFCRGGCSSAIKYKHQILPAVDQTECAFNRAIYPLLVKHLLNGEISVEGWIG